MAVLRIGGQEVRSKWARKSDGSPLWSEKLMLCWDGNMPLNIDMYGGKDHIGQVRSTSVGLFSSCSPGMLLVPTVIAVVVMLLVLSLCYFGQ